MHKMQKKPSKKRKSNKKPNDHSTSKTRTVEENIDSTKRLTIPPDFCRGVVPSSPQKNKRRKVTTDRNGNDCVLGKIRGIFDNCMNIRRSERILKRSNNNSFPNNVNHSNNKSAVDGNSQNNFKYSSDESNQSTSSVSEEGATVKSSVNLNSYENVDNLYFQKPRNVLNDRLNKKESSCKRSKSIFEEINHLYSQSSQINIKLHKSEINIRFCNSLFKNLNKNCAFGEKTLILCKAKISSEIKKIDNILLGIIKMDQDISGMKRECCEDGEDNDGDYNWKYFSKSEWVYHTPPSQRIIPPKIEDYQLQPGIMYTTKKQTQLFELKPDHQLKLDNYEKINDIPINRNLMTHLVTKKFNTNLNMDMEPCSSKSSLENDIPFNFSQPESKEYVPVISKPSKYCNNEIRVNSQVKRKVDEDIYSCYKLNDRNLGFVFKQKVLSADTNEFKLNIPTFTIEQERCDNFIENDGFSYRPAVPLKDSTLRFDFKKFQ